MVDVQTASAFLANGLVFGSILALAAVGLSLVYGILKLSNFAHGDLVTFGAFAALYLTRFGAPWLVPFCLVAAIVLAGLITVDLVWTHRLRPVELRFGFGFGGLLLLMVVLLLALDVDLRQTSNVVLLAGTVAAITVTVLLLIGLEFAIWRPLRRRGGTILTLIIVSIGLGLVLRNALTLEFGGGIHSFARPTPVSSLLLGIPVSGAQRFTVLACALLVLGLHVFLRHSKTGKAMRAVSDNPELARVSGIDVDRVIVYVWTISGAFVAIAGVLYTLVTNNTMNVNMGFQLLLPFFAAVLLGGIGSPYGAVLGGLIVGVAMKLSALWLGSEYEFATAFLILILVLVLRPTGLLGVRR